MFKLKSKMSRLLISLLIFNILFVINIFGWNGRKSSIFGRRVTQNDLGTSLEKLSIIPDVIDSIPLNKIRIRYLSGVEVDFGNELTPMSVKDEPSVEWPTQVGQYYTLIMIDPDAPSRRKPTNREIKHWIVINIPGTDINKGETIAVYRGPTPLKGSDLHRYVFLVYKQNGIIKHNEKILKNSTREGRAHFNSRVFAKTYNLNEPIATNYFLSRYDQYVGLLRAKNRMKNNLKSDKMSITHEFKPRKTAYDWAPRTTKTPKFPQMICINSDRFQQIQQLMDTRKDL